MVIDLFIEIEHIRDDQNMEYRYDSEFYVNIFNSLKDSEHVRLHKIDYRGDPFIDQFQQFVDYIKDAHSGEYINVDLHTVHTYLKMSRDLISGKNFTINFPLLIKQYKKINKFNLLIKLYLHFFRNPFNKIQYLIKDIQRYWAFGNRKKPGEKIALFKKIHENIIISDSNYLLQVNARFMDLYTIGRMLKPGYNYCVLYAGAFHTYSIMKTLEKYNICSSTKHSGFNEKINDLPLTMYEKMEKENA